jgi:hypothetical protein
MTLRIFKKLVDQLTFDPFLVGKKSFFMFSWTVFIRAELRVYKVCDAFICDAYVCDVRDAYMCDAYMFNAFVYAFCIYV